MKSMILSVMIAFGLAFAVPAKAALQNTEAPRRATQGIGGVYGCEQYGPGWQLVSSPQWYTYYQTTTQQVVRRQCVAVGPFGVCRLFTNVVETVPVTVPVTTLVQNNFCIFTGVAPIAPWPVPGPGPVPGPFPGPFAANRN